MAMNEPEIVLASHSPSRKLLFDRAGISCEVLVSGVDESVPPELTPLETVALLAQRKGDAVASLRPEKAVISADSMVALDGEALGKPRSPAHAAEMLGRLAGRAHELCTGVCIHWHGKREVFAQVTKVHFYPLSAEEIAAYVATGEPMGKAGSYGIEGRGVLLISHIEGDYSNIVGLPLAETMRRLREMTR